MSSSMMQEKTLNVLPDDKKGEKDKGEFYVKYRGNTYEISKFLKNHPGGSHALKAFQGLTMDKVLEDVPHSNAAFHLLNEFELNNKRAYDDVENLIDWNEPLLGQVGSLSGRYWEWVNLPVNRPIRLFKSDVIEALTVTPWYIVPIIWIPISMYFLIYGIINNFTDLNANYLQLIIMAFSCGILLWTFIEYTLHRKLFHLKPPSNSKTLISLHFILHGLHHKAPFDARRLLFPPVPALLLTIVFYNLFKLIFPASLIDIIASGTMTGYLSYDLTHYYLHHGSPKDNTYFYDLKRYHNYHHFSHHEQGFGISSKIWDYVFGSLITLRQLKKAIIW